MKILIFLLLFVSSSLNAPVEKYDVSLKKKREEGVRAHSYHPEPKLGRQAKWNFNYKPGVITVATVSGGDFSIGHSAKIKIKESSPQLTDPALPDPGLPEAGLPDPELPDPELPDPELPDPELPDPGLLDPGLLDPGLPNPALPVCAGRPHLLLEDCFCKKTDGSGVLCPGNSRCYRGICTQPPKNPCFFDDDLLNPSICDAPMCSPFDTSFFFQWEDNIVPYYYGNEDTQVADKEFIKTVMNDIEARTCFKFQEKPRTELENNNVHCLEIYINDSPRSCFENVGNVERRPFRPILRLNLLTRVTLPNGEDCGHTGLIIHELMHVLGVAHTQRRRDRRSHIHVQIQNLDQNYYPHYRICEGCILYNEIPYDCGSIMHHGTHDNSQDGDSPVILAEPEIPDPEIDYTINTCNLNKIANFKYVSTASQVSEKDWELLNLIGKCPAGKRKRSIQEASVNGSIIFPI